MESDKDRKIDIDDQITAEHLYFSNYLRRREFFRPKFVNKPIKRFSGFHSKEKVWKDKFLTPNDTILWQNTVLGNILDKSPFKHMHHAVLNNTGTWSTYCWIFHKFREYFTTYGKGTNIAAALASGYGEMLERMQILAFRSKNPYKNQIGLNVQSKLKTQISAFDETINQSAKKILRAHSVGPILTEAKEHKNMQDLFEYEEFYDILNEKSVWIQKSLHRTSTGLAAGNCYEEAFIQSFSEIIERFQEYNILKNKIKLPTINPERLSEKNQSIIQKMAELKVEAIVKDASQDLNIPTVAVLFNFTRQQSNKMGLFSKYLVKFASASSVDVAVERCLGEVIQGLDSLVQKNIQNSRFILYNELIFDEFPQITELIPKRDFYVNFFARKGLYPSTELGFLAENSGNVKYLEYCNNNLKVEVDHILNFARKNDYQIYIHDFGWGGFPALKLFMPQLNVGAMHLSSFSTPKIENFKIKLIKEIRSLNRDDLAILEDPLFLTSFIYYQNMSHFLKIETSTLEQMDAWLYFALVAKAYGLDDLAAKYIKPYLFLTAQKIENISLYNEKKTFILDYLQSITPSCLKSCDECQHGNECRYTVLKQFESDLCKRYEYDIIQKEWRK